MGQKVCVIIDKLASNLYEIRLNESDIVWRRHANQLLSIPSDDILKQIVIPLKVVN